MSLDEVCSNEPPIGRPVHFVTSQSLSVITVKVSATRAIKLQANEGAYQQSFGQL